MVELPAAVGDDILLDLPDRVGDVADHLDVGEIDGIDLGGLGRDMDDRRPARLHEEGRLFDDVVADVDDAVRRLDRAVDEIARAERRSEEHTSELQSLMRISYAVFCLKKKKT